MDANTLRELGLPEEPERAKAVLKALAMEANGIEAGLPIGTCVRPALKILVALHNVDTSILAAKEERCGTT